MNKEKVDKGFELIYENLSNRRKFFRTIWVSLFGVVVLLLLALWKLHWLSILLYGAVMAIVCVWQLITTYRKWKHPSSEEKQEK